MPQPEVTDDLLTQAISAIPPPTAAGGGGLASLFEGGGADPNLIGTLTALQSSPMLRGEAPKAGAGPIGQISQALMPLLAAPLYRRQAEQQQAAEKVKMLFALAQLGGAQAKMKGEAAKGERQKQILNIIAKASGAEGAEGPAGAAGGAGGRAQPPTGPIAEGGGGPARRGLAIPP